MSHCSEFLLETKKIAESVDTATCERIVSGLVELRARRGRLFCFGAGGGAANAEHAVNDFRKLCRIEAYSPTLAEITARTNDEGWDSAFTGWLSSSRPQSTDGFFIFSVGGGDEHISKGILQACRLGPRIFGVVGRDDGEVAKYGRKHNGAVLVVPMLHRGPYEPRMTPHTEAWQLIVLHMLVSHPSLQVAKTRW